MLVEAPQLKIAVEAKTHKIYFLTTELRRVEPRLKEESAQNHCEILLPNSVFLL